MRAAGPGGSAHCEPARGRGAEGPESEGGARLPEWKPLLPPLRRHSPAGRRGPDRGGGAGPGWGGGPRSAAAAAATPGCSTRALRQAAARAHLPVAAPGLTIGCPLRAREIELSIHSWAGRARAAAAELSPRALGDARRPPRPEGASPRGLWARTVAAAAAAGSSLGGCELRGLSLGPAARCTGSWRSLRWRSLGRPWREAEAKL